MSNHPPVPHARLPAIYVEAEQHGEAARREEVGPAWFKGQSYAMRDSIGMLWMRVPRLVPFSDRIALRACMNAFLRGLGVHQHYRFIWSPKYDRRHACVRVSPRGQWRSFLIEPDQWVPVADGGELTVYLTLLMLERGEKPVFPEAPVPTTVVEWRDVAHRVAP